MTRDWDLIARKAGYASEEDMISTLYIQEEMTLAQLSDLLKITRQALSQKLEKFGIKARGRGGANNNKHLCQKLNLMDPRIIWLFPKQAAAELQIGLSTLYRLRKETIEQ